MVVHLPVVINASTRRSMQSERVIAYSSCPADPHFPGLILFPFSLKQAPVLPVTQDHYLKMDVHPARLTAIKEDLPILDLHSLGQGYPVGDKNTMHAADSIEEHTLFQVESRKNHHARYFHQTRPLDTIRRPECMPSEFQHRQSPIVQV